MYSTPFNGTLFVTVHCTARNDGVPVGHGCTLDDENMSQDLHLGIYAKLVQCYRILTSVLQVSYDRDSPTQ